MSASQQELEKRRKKESRLRVHRTLLIQSLSEHLVPALTRHGFSAIAKDGGTVDSITRATLPFGVLRRLRADGGTDLAEVQLKAHGNAAFRINACQVPREGLMTLGGHRAVQELEAGGLHDHYEMYAQPTLRRWFALWFWIFREPSKERYDKLVIDVARFLPEIDDALQLGQLGPHMRFIRFSD